MPWLAWKPQDSLFLVGGLASGIVQYESARLERLEKIDRFMFCSVLGVIREGRNRGSLMEDKNSVRNKLLTPCSFVRLRYLDSL